MAVQIEGLDFTLFADRDRQNLVSLSFEGRVTWFVLRFQNMLVEPLRALKPRDRGRTQDDLWSLLLFGSVLFNGVEALGSFCAPLGTSNFGRFKAFVRGFLGPVYDQHEGILWGFRNSLAHGLTVERGAFEFFDGPPLRIEDGVVQIDPDALFRDFQRALSNYVADLRASSATSNLRINFERRFEDRYEVPPCPTSVPRP